MTIDDFNYMDYSGRVEIVVVSLEGDLGSKMEYELGRFSVIGTGAMRVGQCREQAGRTHGYLVI